jgi:hypothetical protein
MSVTSYEQVLRVAATLPRQDQLRLIQELSEQTSCDAEQATSVMELCGLGQEIWQQKDAQEYVNSERASWNG